MEGQRGGFGPCGHLCGHCKRDLAKQVKARVRGCGPFYVKYSPVQDKREMLAEYKSPSSSSSIRVACGHACSCHWETKNH